jgi:hypothetical protein
VFSVGEKEAGEELGFASQWILTLRLLRGGF